MTALPLREDDARDLTYSLRLGGEQEAQTPPGVGADVADVAVVGSPDERMGEVGRAFVVRAAASDPDPDALVGWARQRMANFKMPRRFTWLDELPRNATGKVQKFRLRDYGAPQ